LEVEGLEKSVSSARFLYGGQRMNVADLAVFAGLVSVVGLVLWAVGHWLTR
jgi:hypothetical protein